MRLQVQAGPDSAQAGALLIDKQLLISGPREWTYDGRAWRLSAPVPIASLPLRHCYASGGALRLSAQDPALSAAPADELLPAPDAAGHRLHLVAPGNPLGRGFARAWHLQATGLRSWPAAQIEYLHQPISGDIFWRAAQDSAVLPPSAAPCVMGRAWRPRRDLAGHLPAQTYAEDEIPFLPPDFDFRYWNAAPADQQCRYLQAGDVIRLTNLSQSGDPAASVDAHGNHILQCSLPPSRCIAMISSVEQGEVMLDVQELHIDTLLYEQHSKRLLCTWRLCLPASPEIVGIRLLYLQDEAQLARLRTLQQEQARLAQIQARQG